MIKFLSILITSLGIPITIYLASGIFTDERRSEPFLSGFRESKRMIEYPTRLIRYGFLFLVFESLILIFLFLREPNLIYALLFTAMMIASVVLIND